MGDDKLTEILGIEISQGVITCVEEAIDWVKGTFLYRRIQSHPLFYGFSERCDGSLQNFLADKCSTSIEKLHKIHAIKMNEDGSFSHMAACHIMSRNFVDCEFTLHKTIHTITSSHIFYSYCCHRQLKQ